MRKRAHINSRYINQECDIHVEHYITTGRRAISLYDATTGEPVAKATLNMPEVALDPDEVILKGYEENEGLPQALEAAGVVGPATATMRCGFTVASIHKLLLKEFP